MSVFVLEVPERSPFIRFNSKSTQNLSIPKWGAYLSKNLLYCTLYFKCCFILAQVNHDNIRGNMLDILKLFGVTMLEFELQVVHSIPCDSTLDDPMYICEHTRRFLMSPDWVFFNVISNCILVTFLAIQSRFSHFSVHLVTFRPSLVVNLGSFFVPFSHWLRSNEMSCLA